VTRTSVDRREEALTAFLDERIRAGYSVETRTATQAIIVRHGRLSFLLGRFRGGSDDRRLVVSVDSEGGITAVAAEPRRW
jgi:hypothetical protein